jgi:hypothetical protein
MADKEQLARKSGNRTLKIVALITCVSFLYAVIRYNIFGTTPWKDLPLFILNKAISLTAFILFSISYSYDYLNKKIAFFAKSQLDKWVIIEATYSLIIIHIVMSFLLFKPEVYAKFFEVNGTLNNLGSLSMFAGIISFALVWSYKQYSLSNNKDIKQPLISLPGTLNGAILLMLVHLFFMGFNGWMTPEKWYGGMPPISLIAFFFGIVGIFFNYLGKTQKE